MIIDTLSTVLQIPVFNLTAQLKATMNMSSSEENTSENQAPESNGSGEANSLIHEINELTFQTRLWRIGAVVGVLLIISLFILSTYRHIRGEFPKSNEELQEFAKKIQDDAGPLIGKTRKLVADTLKESREEVSKQLKLLWTDKGGEVLSVAAGELETLVSSVPDNAISGYNKELNKVLSKSIDGLKFPEGGSGKVDSGKLAKIINEGLMASSTNRTGDILAIMFEPHVMELSSMSNHLNNIYDKEYGSMKEKEKQFTLSMALTLIERVNVQLKEAEDSLRTQQENEKAESTEAEKNSGRKSPQKKK